MGEIRYVGTQPEMCVKRCQNTSGPHNSDCQFRWGFINAPYLRDFGVADLHCTTHCSFLTRRTTEEEQVIIDEILAHGALVTLQPTHAPSRSYYAHPDLDLQDLERDWPGVEITFSGGRLHDAKG